MPLIAAADVTLHLVIGEGVGQNGDPVELTEAKVFKVGDLIPPLDQLAKYQRDALTDPKVDKGHLRGTVEDVSDEELARIQARKNIVPEMEVTIQREEGEEPEQPEGRTETFFADPTTSTGDGEPDQGILAEPAENESNAGGEGTEQGTSAFEGTQE